VRGVRLEDGTVLESDIVISNIDASLTRRELLGECGPAAGRSVRADPSMAGFALYLGVRRRYEALTQHNIFFSRDYREEFRRIFEDHRPAEDPTIYVCASCLRDPDHAPPGGMNLFILVNVPAADGAFDWSSRKAEYRDLIIRALESKGLEGLNSATECEEIVTPADFERKYNAPGGAIYGNSSNSRWAAFRRPPNRSRELRGLYFAGGSAHPGGGIPLVLLSGAHAAELVRKDHA
jgi:phytoene desaturase